MNSVSMPSFVLKPLLAAMLLASFDAFADGPVVPPDSGAILQQLQPGLPVAPPSAPPSVDIAPQATPALPTSAPFEVKGIRFTGNTAFSSETLHGLVASDEGRALTLGQVNALAERVAVYYQSHGYPLAQAVVPPQRMSEGIVTIQVVEAKYGEVRLHNRSRVKNALLDATLAPLHPGEAIEGDKLNRTLLLMSDIPGVAVSATLKPGSTVGRSDVTVDTDETPTTLGNVSVDNYGNRYIGRVRGSGNLVFVNPLHHGDILSATVLTTGSDMQYGRLAYDTLLNGVGTRVGAAYSLLHYKLGDNISALDAHGTANVASAWVKQPLIRSKQVNVYAQLEYDEKWLRDHIDVGDIHTDRHLGDWILSVNGDVRDTVLRGAISLWSIGWTNGRSSFDDDTARSSDAGTARTSGGFSKWNANFSRLQGVTSRDTVYFNVGGQWADSNLDSSEKMTIGGPYSVRAYDIGAASGDVGYLATLELRHDLGTFLKGQWQVLAFFDTAYVKVNRHPWSTGENSATLSGTGVGVNWSGPYNLHASASIATPVGGASSLVADTASVRAWLTLSKGF